MVLDTIEKMRAMFPFLTQEEKDALVADNILSIDFEATTNQSVVYRNYSGTAHIRAIYRAFGEVVDAATPFVRIELQPDTTYAVAGLIMKMEPDVVAALVAANGGTMPSIQPPIIPEPVVVEPEPEPETPVEPTEPATQA